MKKIKITADTPLSALFYRTVHEDLRQVIDSWRPFLVDCPSDVDALALTHFCFDRRRINARQVYMVFADLMERGALRPSMRTLADYLFVHTNLSQSASTLYQLLARCRRDWEERAE